MLHAKDKRLIHITTARKSAGYVKQEVEALGYKVQTVTENGLFLKGDYRDCINLNFNLRTAYRVMWHLKDMHTPGPDQLYKEAKKFPWEELIDADGYISIQSFVKNDQILDTRFANVRLKDAIVDRINDKLGRRPDSGPDTSRTVIYLYWVENKASVYLDTSGGALSKHGYRKMPYKAPMVESLAASTIAASGWDMNSNFINPMCGSGTLAIEAALLAINKVPGLLKDNFGFMHTKLYDPVDFREVKRKAMSQLREMGDFKIVASDLNPVAVHAAKTNAEIAGVADLIEFKVCDFRDTPVYEGGGVVMVNPEYGERLGDEEALVPVYKALGDFFKSKCQGYKGYIFTGNLNLAKNIGLRTSKRVEFYNGRIECRLLEYELYRGSKKKTGKG
ncbi:class I SAM-dependent RNA methyltransferase [Cytophagaceae bacterium ABcell3]|nr:class I SAM-dependent RNA methyltransferase [Cytophagaceae bacterium ABcell3]